MTDLELQKHLDIALVARQRGFLTHEQFEHGISLVRVARGALTPELWIKAGLLTAAQLTEVLRSLGSDRVHAAAQQQQQQQPQPQPPPPQAPVAATPLPAESERYEVRDVLGIGGMGHVENCLDTRLEREVAMKRLRPDLRRSADAVQMLRREARIIARLEHPGVIPIYDIGTSDIGPYYVMRKVTQASLEDVLDGLRTSDERTKHQYTLGRLLRIFVQMCQAVDYANSHGVVHCDLKPANILLGTHGEVLVVDWGLAYDVADGTCFRGGTPGYMAPEQADPNHHHFDARTDVFALGAILYEILCHEAPVPLTSWYDPENGGPPRFHPPKRPRERDPQVPEELDEICMIALAPSPGDRYPNAAAIAEATELFLEGTHERERKLARANELVEQAQRLAAAYHDLLDARPDLLDEVQTITEQIEPWDSTEKKRIMWDAEDRLAITDALGVRTLQAAVTSYEQALEEVPGHAVARHELARLYAAQVERARERRAEYERIYFEELVKQFDDHGDTVRAMRNGWLRIVRCGPNWRSVEASLSSLEEQERRLVAVRPKPLPQGDLPIAAAAGSYIVRVSHNNRDAVLPVVVRAGREITLEVDVAELKLLRDDEILISRGPALIGEQSDLPGSGEREVEVPSFILYKFPVTFSEYLAFVAAVAAKDPARAKLLAPQTRNGDPYWMYAKSRFIPARISEFGEDPSVLMRCPVFGIDIASALAYADWLSEKTGVDYRLPNEHEWEKAARGVDGRRFPWGDRFDPAFCKMRNSRPGVARPEPVGNFPHDMSPYGVRDLAGGIAEWVLPANTDPREAQGKASNASAVATRGGAWCDSASDCRLSARRPMLPVERSPRLGLRLARSV